MCFANAPAIGDRVTTEMTVFVDMDGVLVDFVGAVCRLFHKDPEQLPEWDWSKGRSLHVPLGLEKESDMWEVIDRHGPSFWASLEPYPWWRELLHWCGQLGKTYLCSTPSLSNYSVDGKLLWIHKHLGKLFRNYIFTAAPKHLLANSRSVLIDDYGSTIEKFCKAGGHGILFPQPWNDAPTKGNPLMAIQPQLNALYMTHVYRE